MTLKLAFDDDRLRTIQQGALPVLAHMEMAVQLIKEMAMEKVERTVELGINWIASLRRELDASEHIEEHVRKVDSVWADGLVGAGIRLGFPLFYAYYDKLRAELERLGCDDWVQEVFCL